MSKFREIIKRVIKEEITKKGNRLKEDFYDNRKSSREDNQYDEISDDQKSYLEDKINEEFGGLDYWYIDSIVSFPRAEDGSTLFITCSTDETPIKHRSFRCDHIEGDNLRKDGALSSHERNAKTIYQSE